MGLTFLTRYTSSGLQRCITVFVLSLLLFLSGGLWAGGYSDAYRAYFIQSNARFMSWHTGADWHYLQAQCYQESLFDPRAKSPAGAMGVCQFMPGTWKEVSGQLGFANISPYAPKANILAAGFYMSRLLRGWTTERTQIERLRFAWSSYNCGFGCVLRAQRAAEGASEYERIKKYLPKETQTYVVKIEYYHGNFREN